MTKFIPEPATSYSLELGGYGQAGSYECLAEAGPYPTLRKARREMRKMQGKRFLDLIHADPRMVTPYDGVPKRTSIVMGVTICAYNNEVGTYYHWEHGPNGKLNLQY